MMRISAKPINFKFNQYLSNGYEFLKNNFGNLLLAFFFCMIMSFIPLCGFLAVGNFYKYCRGLRRGQQVTAGDIFNFDNFSAYLILQLILIGIIILFYIPLMIMFPMIANSGGEPSAGFWTFFIIYIIALYVGIFIIAVKAFYIPALISLGGVTEIKTAWKMSVTMGKGNFWSILLFSLVVAFLGQLGILACGIGLILTMPFIYTANYFAFEDAMQQIEHDEITEIGVKNEY